MNELKENFLNKSIEAAHQASLLVPTFNVVIAVAQSVLESGWGTSLLSTEANNLKGVKAGSSWAGETLDLPTKEQNRDGSWRTEVARWRKYPNWQAAFEDYGKLVERVYPDAAAKRGNSLQFLNGLLDNVGYKYATDLSYVDKVWNIVVQNNLLERYAKYLDAKVKRNVFVVIDSSGKETAFEIPEGYSVVQRFTPDGDKTYVHIRKG